MSASHCPDWFRHNGLPYLSISHITATKRLGRGRGSWAVQKAALRYLNGFKAFGLS